MSSLPTIPLPYPLLVLPATRYSIPLTEDAGDAIHRLLSTSDSLPIVATVPILDSESQKFAEWGTAARVLRLLRPAGRSPTPYVVLLHGLARIRFPDGVTPTTSTTDVLPLNTVEYPPTDADSLPSADIIARFKHTALRVLERLSTSPSPTSNSSTRKETYRKIASLLEDLPNARSPWMADVLIGSLPSASNSTPGTPGATTSPVISYNDKLAILRTPNPTQRLILATEIMAEYAGQLEVDQKVRENVDESLSKAQKEFWLRQQMAAIQKELRNLESGSPSSSPSLTTSSATGAPASIADGANPRAGLDTSDMDEDANSSDADADEFNAIKMKIAASMMPGTEERKVAVREWKRLKRIPGGSVESGVVRGYLEWLLALPWPQPQPVPTSTSLSFPTSTTSSTSSLNPNPPPPPSSTSTTESTSSFLAAARAQLDADHYGLDKVKKRLIEYLAVVKLREMVWKKEVAAQAERERERVALEQAKAEQDKDTAKEVNAAATADTKSDADVNAKALVPYTPPPPKPTPSTPTRFPRAPILLLTGPPGTGKTSLGQSIAKTLHLPFQRISLGGVRDEAEIRGHRRTYVASGPGGIVQALRRAWGEVKDAHDKSQSGQRGAGVGVSGVKPEFPGLVLLLDEIDKLSSTSSHSASSTGDPSAALLEVLDPEQNDKFVDHYIGVPVDLSRVLFVCTANGLEGMGRALVDRCEVVQVGGYTYDEKMHIASRFLLPKQLRLHSLSPEHIHITPDALMRITTEYTHEAGVRSLERAIGAVVRSKVVEMVKWGVVDGHPSESTAASMSGGGAGAGGAKEVVIEATNFHGSDMGNVMLNGRKLDVGAGERLKRMDDGSVQVTLVEPRSEEDTLGPRLGLGLNKKRSKMSLIRRGSGASYGLGDPTKALIQTGTPAHVGFGFAGAGAGRYNPVVGSEDLVRILGMPRYELSADYLGPERGRVPTLTLPDSTRGLIWGLVVSGIGEGSVMPVECTVVPGGSGRLRLTGSLGEVIRESGELALSWVKTNAWDLGIASWRGVDVLKDWRALEERGVLGGVRVKGSDPYVKGSLAGKALIGGGGGGGGGAGAGVGGEERGSGGIDIHIHLPAGAQKKDGPSAGVAMVCALVSLLTGECVPTNVAMTGEITLRGRVTPVGGVKEKVLGAHRSHITKVILPWGNRHDVEQDVPALIRDEMEFVFVRSVRECLEAAFGKGVFRWRESGPGSRGDEVLLESRL